MNVIHLYKKYYADTESMGQIYTSDQDRES